jgi:hypothetical protein
LAAQASAPAPGYAPGAPQYQPFPAGAPSSPPAENPALAALPNVGGLASGDWLGAVLVALVVIVVPMVVGALWYALTVLLSSGSSQFGVTPLIATMVALFGLTYGGDVVRAYDDVGSGATATYVSAVPTTVTFLALALAGLVFVRRLRSSPPTGTRDVVAAIVRPLVVVGVLSLLVSVVVRPSVDGGVVVPNGSTVAAAGSSVSGTVFVAPWSTFFGALLLTAAALVLSLVLSRTVPGNVLGRWRSRLVLPTTVLAIPLVVGLAASVVVLVSAMLDLGRMLNDSTGAIVLSVVAYLLALPSQVLTYWTLGSLGQQNAGSWSFDTGSPPTSQSDAEWVGGLAGHGDLSWVWWLLPLAMLAAYVVAAMVMILRRKDAAQAVRDLAVLAGAGAVLGLLAVILVGYSQSQSVTYPTGDGSHSAGAVSAQGYFSGVSPTIVIIAPIVAALCWLAATIVLRSLSPASVSTLGERAGILGVPSPVAGYPTAPGFPPAAGYPPPPGYVAPAAAYPPPPASSPPPGYAPPPSATPTPAAAAPAWGPPPAAPPVAASHPAAVDPEQARYEAELAEFERAQAAYEAWFRERGMEPPQS